MNPVFFHELPLIVSIQGKPKLAHVAAGFSKAVDPQSGMTVNLKDILDWEDQWKAQSSSRQWNSWFDFLSDFRNFIQSKSQSAQAHIASLQVRFFDQSLLRWQEAGVTVTRKLVGELENGKLKVLEIGFDVKSESEILQALDFSLPVNRLIQVRTAQELGLMVEQQSGLKVQTVEIQDPLTELSEIQYF